ncbi:MAG: hypothetical protein FWC26_09405 [Fibromonadales bacterium]|nr:hypothetical protein [Fibromonadales bacterium]
MIGRELKEHNDLFFLCSLIDYIARKIKSHRTTVANAIGKDELNRIFGLADVYHSENIDKISDELIEKFAIQSDSFPTESKYSLPSHWDIGKVYKRLVINIAEQEQIDFIQALLKAYNSPISEKIENFNSSLYYENPSYIFACYQEGKVL